MAGAHVLDTARLLLRHLTEADASFILELLNERGFIENIGDRGVRSLDDARRYISEGPGASYQRYGYGLWAIQERAGGQTVGICGLVRRDGLEDADIGYAVLERFSGRGYATEAAAGVLDYARRVIGLDKVVAITTLKNEPSMAVLRQIGLRYVGLIRLSGHEEETAFFTT